MAFFWKYSERTGGSNSLQKESGEAYKEGVLLSQPEDGRTPAGRPRRHGAGQQASGESLMPSLSKVSVLQRSEGIREVARS